VAGVEAIRLQPRQPASPPAPTVSLSVSQPKVSLGSSANITWTSTNATSCTASGGWAGTQAVSGTALQTPASAGVSRYTLTCRGVDYQYLSTGCAAETQMFNSDLRNKKRLTSLQAFSILMLAGAFEPSSP
jgi:hypothetical protein